MKILFVCSGNVFRSLIAEKCFNAYVARNHIQKLQADSAGTCVTPQKPLKVTLERLAFYNIKPRHRYKQLSQKLIDKNDLIIAMNTDHQDYIKENFKVYAPLFNEVAYGKHKGIADFQIAVNNLQSQKAIRKYAYFLVDYIYKATPKLVANLDKWVGRSKNQ